MKRIAFAGVALGALTFGAYAGGTPGFSPVAAQMLTGDLAIYGGFARTTQEGSDDESGTLFGGLARAQYFFMPNWSVQFDINGESFYNGDNNKDAVFNLAGHIGYHAPAWMIGAMLSKGYSDEESNNFVTAALEGMYRMGSLVFYGQLGYTTEWAVSEDHAIYVHKELMYFLNPNLMIAGDLGYAWNHDGSDDIGILRWGLTIEKKFATAPFGVFGRVEGSFQSNDNDDDRSEAAIKVGLRGYFYNGPLQNGLVRRDFNPYTGVNYVRDID